MDRFHTDKYNIRMTEARRHINRWWLVSLLLVLLTACAGSDTDTPTPPQPGQDPVLTFYVYAPERPLMTRTADDDVSALDAENAIHSLQIWVFESDTKRLVGYLSPDTYPTDEEGTKYQMSVSKSFANAATKPNVDVYVVANAAAAGLSSLGESTTRDELEDVVIGSDYFGVGAPTSKITEGKGLPMSGVLRNQGIIGSNPVLSIGEGSTMAKVRLLRAVSKVRFVFCRKTGGETVSITGITINGNMIPAEEYVFLTDHDYRIGNSYEPLSATLLTKPTGDIKQYETPPDYVYNSQTSQDYENLIDNGVANSQLTQAGPYYFKETDKQVSGTITYRVGSANAQSVSFYMTADNINKRFVRNHSWIVYAYYNGPAGEPIISVWVDTNWQSGDYFLIEN